MSRARNIKPGFFKNDILAECDPLARLLFAGLWCEADREGRLEDRPRRIKAECLPYDDCDVNELLSELEIHGFIRRYVVGKNTYIQILEFKKHQNPHVREGASQIPAPDKHSESTVQAPDKHRASPADSPSLIPDTKEDDDDAREPPAEATAEPVPGEQDLPAWVPVTTWREFYRHRAVIRKPLSIPGQRQVVKRLTELRGQGADIGASLEQTMAAGLAIPVLPRDPDQPGESHANRSSSRKLSSVERVQANIARRRAAESGGGAGSHLDADGLPVRALVDQPVRRPA